MQETKNTEIPIAIDPDQISEQTLNSIIESFILREGTDYGSVEISLEKKSAQIRKQIEKGDIKIFFDQATESITLITARDLSRFESSFTK